MRTPLGSTKLALPDGTHCPAQRNKLTVIIVIQLAVQRSKNLRGTQCEIKPRCSRRKSTGGIPMTGRVTLNKPKRIYMVRPRRDRIRFWKGFKVAWRCGGRAWIFPLAKSTTGGGCGSVGVVPGGEGMLSQHHRSLAALASP